MAKFYGKIGYINTKEKTPGSGVWIEELIEKTYSGEILRNSRRIKNGESINDDIVISNQISIIADPYSTNNFMNIKYAEVYGCKWKVTTAEVLYPRIVLTLGEIYNATTN